MEQQKEVKLDAKTIKTWKHHLQDEIDANFLYSAFANLEPDPDRKDILLELAEVENRHVARWEEMLTSYNVKIKKGQPTFKAKFWAWYARKFGSTFPLARMLNEEADEVKDYLTLYRNSTLVDAKETALDLAKESAMHTESLQELTGTSDEPWHKIESGGMLGNIVYGFNDGLTANFGLLAGIVAATSETPHILVGGIVGTVADSLSMGASGYLAAKSEQEVYEHEIEMEREEIRLMPDIEEDELTLIYATRGIPKEQARLLAKEVMSDPERALQEKIQAELKIGETHTTPFKDGWVTGLATAIGAFIPVAPFLFTTVETAIWISFSVAMISHFAVGAARSLFTGRGLIRSGIDMFVVGLGVAGVGFLVGKLLERYVLIYFLGN
ncbi:MAG: VIT1/CCC1 transporter family protein [Candidatus Poribacteria bacterium]|nr:VIT1/CCC1 transporter family protein [Candidatus Poribacteria bacterium]